MFIETFAALRTYMSALSEMQDRFVSADGNIPDELCTVIMDFSGDGSALGAVVQSLLHP